MNLTLTSQIYCSLSLVLGSSNVTVLLKSMLTVTCTLNLESRNFQESRLKCWDSILEFRELSQEIWWLCRLIDLSRIKFTKQTALWFKRLWSTHCRLPQTTFVSLAFFPVPGKIFILRYLKGEILCNLRDQLKNQSYWIGTFINLNLLH